MTESARKKRKPLKKKVRRGIRPDINHALVEDTRPPIYKAMKYWGKKPQ